MSWRRGLSFASDEEVWVKAGDNNMGGYILLGGSIIVGMALLENAHGTINMVKVIITVRGITWICKKVAESLDKDKSQIIDYTGWSIAGCSVVGILGNAVKSVEPLMGGIGKISGSIQGLGLWINRLVDGVTFWQ
ncbi:MAG: hypothetical protein PHT02_00020 [Tissierellia bacterium]|nr:hypothetical protein [Tissierellia bacterium]